MYTMSTGMANKKNQEEIVPSTEGRINFQIWLKGEEKFRYQEVLRRALARQPRGDGADVNRRLLGLDPDTDGFVVDKDVRFFRNEPEENNPGVDTRKYAPVKTKPASLDTRTRKKGRKGKKG